MNKNNLYGVRIDTLAGKLRCIGFAGFIALVACSAHAQEGAVIHSEMLNQTNHWITTVSLDYSYVGAGSISFQGLKGNSDAQTRNADLGLDIPLNDHWSASLGISFQDVLLGTVTDAPIPERIDTMNFDAGLGYRLNDRWSFAGSIGPQLYRLDGIDGSDIGIGGAVNATWKWKPNLTLVAGVAFDPANKFPVLPDAGLRWDIRTNLILNLMFPKPALIYRVNSRLALGVGASADFDVFRADQNLGDKIGQPSFDNALGTYQDFHIGAGAYYRLWRQLSIGIEGGYSAGREIDYSQINQTVKFNSSPFVQIALKWRF
ncbi:MAG TPA: DUF6268 family outer membrane beta-barrel protein [Candidatus Sulfotelmatobacter sp.]|nr:DUF6268 family outer membrane beta-barrel protein [Candidatus Sulfotelmatobacter sp.]